MSDKARISSEIEKVARDLSQAASATDQTESRHIIADCIRRLNALARDVRLASG